jgi:hypothetical protein
MLEVGPFKIVKKTFFKAKPHVGSNKSERCQFLEINGGGEGSGVNMIKLFD